MVGSKVTLEPLFQSGATEHSLHIVEIPQLLQEKMASRISCKNSEVIQLSNEKLRCFRTVTVVWHDDTSSSPSSDSMATTRKTASRNYCKNLSTIQRSDQKLEPFRAVTLVWRDRTFASYSRDSIDTTRKMAFRNSNKNSRVIQRSDQKLRRF